LEKLPFFLHSSCMVHHWWVLVQYSGTEGKAFGT
jgi:hypothetical protein